MVRRGFGDGYAERCRRLTCSTWRLVTTASISAMAISRFLRSALGTAIRARSGDLRGLDADASSELALGAEAFLADLPKRLTKCFRQYRALPCPVGLFHGRECRSRFFSPSAYANIIVAAQVILHGGLQIAGAAVATRAGTMRGTSPASVEAPPKRGVRGTGTMRLRAAIVR